VKREILVVNCGSSSIKFSLFRQLNGGFDIALDGQIEELGHSAKFHFQSAQQNSFNTVEIAPETDHRQALQSLLQWLEPRLDASAELVIGHRVVHGGAQFQQPTVIDNCVLAELQKLIPLAPLHQPHNLLAIETLARLRPDVTQVACFDTAFHATQSRTVQQFALPDHYYDQGLRSYGFHGLSYQHIANHLQQLDPALAAGKLVVAHLGNGASLCAMDNARSVDCSMSFSALDGLVMGTRSGALDPGVLLYLLLDKKLQPQQLSDLLYKESGLLGLSQLSSDMRELLDSDAEPAKRAIDIYLYRLCREIAAMVGTLQGIDGLIFTGGVGENSTQIRQQVCERLAWLGVSIDAAKNHAGSELISTPASAIKVYAVQANEERVIAELTATAVTTVP
jgi:acetate kinase